LTAPHQVSTETFAGAEQGPGQQRLALATR
jgi:hypothetical protein